MVLGITGGVGTGKSTILSYLKDEYHAAIIIADDVARDLMMPGEVCYISAVGHFGEKILQNGPGSEIDRAALASIVFQDEQELKCLNKMVHPQVKDRITELISRYRKEGLEWIVVETAILIQAGYLTLVDQLWLVTADYEVRLKRLEESRGYSKEKTDSIISSQMSDDEMKTYADYVIDNSGSVETTREQIRRIINSYSDKQ